MTTALFCRASGFGPMFAIFEAEQGAEALQALRRQSGFTRESCAPTDLLPFSLMNRAFNLAARMSDDRQFGARIGQVIRIEDFGPFLEYSLRGETLGQVIRRVVATEPLHHSDSITDLRAAGDRAIWRIRYHTKSEPTVEHHAQRSMMQMLHILRRYGGGKESQIEVRIAEPYAAEARLLECRIGLAVHARTSDYEVAFPAAWLDVWTPLPGAPPDLQLEFLAAYRDRPLPRMMAEALLIALDLHDALPRNGLGSLASDFGLPRRTLQHALRREGVTYREIVQSMRMRRAQRLLAATNAPLAEVALRVGYTDPANFHRAFLSLTGMTPGRYRATSRTPNPNG